MNLKVSTTRAQIAIAMATRLGISKEKICSETGLKGEIIDDVDGYISYKAYLGIFSAGVRLSKNDFFWLRHIDADIASKNNILWYYGLNAVNVFEAVERVNRIYVLVNNVFNLEPLIQGGEFIIRFKSLFPKVELSEYLLDWAFSQWWGSVLTFAGSDIKLLKIRIKHNSEHRIKAYQDFFQVPVEGGHSFDELVFEKDSAFMPNAYANIDPNLDIILEQLITPELEDKTYQNNFEQELLEAIQRELVHGTPSLSTIATRLGMSSRTLQRRLGDLGHSYTHILSEHRHTLAISYLKQSRFNITEVAFMLGYKKQGSFTSAFRSKEGITPTEYRKRFVV